MLVHYDWCGLTGEINFDYKIKKTDSKGFGMFALRNFKKNDKIMIEKAVLSVKNISNNVNLLDLCDNFDKIASNYIKFAIIKLYTPHHYQTKEESLYKISNYNALDLGYDDLSSICLDISRINHSCDCNAAHKFIANSSKNFPFIGFKLIIANKDIKIGDEILISYADPVNHKNSKDRQQHLFKIMDFGVIVNFALISAPIRLPENIITDMI
jgi:SET domain-containing protein